MEGPKSVLQKLNFPCFCRPLLNGCCYSPAIGPGNKMLLTSLKFPPHPHTEGTAGQAQAKQLAGKVHHLWRQEHTLPRCGHCSQAHGGQAEGAGGAHAQVLAQDRR